MKQQKYEIEYVGFDNKRVLLPERVDTLKECEVVLKKLRKEEFIQIAVIFIVNQPGKFRVYKFKRGEY